MKNIFYKTSNKNGASYFRNNICIALCSIYIVSFVGFVIPSIISGFNTELSLLLYSYLVFPYLICAFIIPVPATFFCVYAVKYNKTHFGDFEDESKTEHKNIVCIRLLHFVIPTAIFYGISALRM